MNAIEVRNLGFTYPNKEKKALDGVSFSVGAGEFIVLCGSSGSGKSTLLRLLKPELSPHGTRGGEIRLFGKNAEEMPPRDSASGIGFLLQNTEYQTVTHTVRGELAFGLENLGMDSGAIRLRMAEIAAYFSLEDILDKKVGELSGGQKQMLCLASVCAMRPGLLLLDEPSSQLDPAASILLFDTVERLCRENGMTVLVSEHRLDNLIPRADRMLVLDGGKLICDCPPGELPNESFYENEFIGASMPAPMRIFAGLGHNGRLPVSVAEGKRELERLIGGKTVPPVDIRRPEVSREYAVEMKNVSHSYGGGDFVLRGMDLKIPVGSFYAVMGANAAGKTTAVSLMSGITECLSGKIKIFGRDIKKYSPKELYRGTLAVLPQKCEALFGGNTVYEDLMYSLSALGLKNDEKREKIKAAAEFFELDGLLETHPYDLSGGELQKAALAMILMKEPRLIFLDEPTKGVDNVFKRKLARKLRLMCDSGATVVAVSHDVEFVAEYCDGAALVFDGRCVLQADVYSFFSGNYFYTTAANKTARELIPGAVTVGQVTDVCRRIVKN